MMEIQEKPLSDDLHFGARVAGTNLKKIGDADVKQRLNRIFHERGLIVFEDLEPSIRLQVELSQAFGSLQGHALNLALVDDDDAAPGMVDFDSRPGEADVFEVNGRKLSGYIPWHFDACYVRELNRAAILRSLVIPPQGGTGFADGIQMYHAIPPAMREAFDNANIIYNAHLMFHHMRFGKPESYIPVRTGKNADRLLKDTEGATRSIHLAIWQRDTGEKILYVFPWQADGIEGMENREGDELLEALCQEMYSFMRPYYHHWKNSDMVVWDNWRLLHCACGNDPSYYRRMHRTTINGDYGLGRFEKDDVQMPPAGAMV